MSAVLESYSTHNFDVYVEGLRVPVSIHAGHISIASSSVSVPEKSRDRLLGLTAPRGTPKLATHLSDKFESLTKPTKVNDVFSDLQERLSGTALEGHLIQLKSKTGGRSTWYGVVDELTDEALLAFSEEGERIVRSSNVRTGRNLNRRLEPFLALRDSILHPEITEEIENDRHMGVAIKTAGILSLGTIATIALMRKTRR